MWHGHPVGSGGRRWCEQAQETHGIALCNENVHRHGGATSTDWRRLQRLQLMLDVRKMEDNDPALHRRMRTSPWEKESERVPTHLATASHLPIPSSCEIKMRSVAHSGAGKGGTALRQAGNTA